MNVQTGIDWSNPCDYLRRHKLPASTIQTFREGIKSDLGDIETWDVAAIEKLVKLYDQYFFEGALLAQIAKRGIKVEFGVGSVKTSDAVKDKTTTGFVRPNVETRSVLFHINVPLVEEVVTKDPKRHTQGIDCTSVISCTQIILEHELVHLVVSVFCYKKGRTWDGSGHTKTFVAIRYNWFRHLSNESTVSSPFEEARLWTSIGQHMYSAARLRALQDLNLKKGHIVKIPDKIKGWHPDLLALEGFAGAYVKLPDDVRKLRAGGRYPMVVQLTTMKKVRLDLRLSMLELMPQDKALLKVLRQTIRQMHTGTQWTDDVTRKPYISTDSGDWVVDLHSRGTGVSLISLIKEQSQEKS